MVSVIGTGEMAKAIVSGIRNLGEKIRVVGRDEEKLHEFNEEFGVEAAKLKSYNIQDQTVILCIKPSALKDVANQLQGEAKVLISILAGTPLRKLTIIPAKYYIRAMPNIGARKKASMTTLTGDEGGKERAIELFEELGKTLWVESERALDIATAIAGSGPAFLALVAEALVDGGVYAGLKREEALFLTQGLFESFSALKEEPALIKNQVMSPNGTTSRGYKALEDKAVRSAFMEAVIKAFERTQE
ncbi:MAG: pyrroline-5-carboxylate reductase [Epsilonproteobacteria bacterium]|nr:pyrroline-5-carboxylate reductase [Campylobacterota bacterium]